MGRTGWRDHLRPPVWDSLAIAEYVAESFPQKEIWPADKRARARARAMAAEMHSGFRNLRGSMPMNIRISIRARDARRTPHVTSPGLNYCGARRAREFAGDSGGPFLFGDFCAADAMFAPVVMRFNTYHPPLAEETLRYCAAITAATSVAEWSAAARRETEFVEEDEPYAVAPAKPAGRE